MATSNEEVLVRPYEETDYPAVKETLVEGQLFYEGMDSAERLAGKIRRDLESILVAVEDGEVVGNVFTMEDGGWGAFIFRLAVRKAHRGRGIGKRLMEEAEQRLLNRGHEEVHILVSEEDAALQGYYELLGYEKGYQYRWMYKSLLNKADDRTV